MPKDDVIIVLTTVPDRETSGRLAHGLVSEGIAACVNEMPGVRSTYVWQKKIEVKEEVQLVIKSCKARRKEIFTYLTTHHPFDTPEFLVIPVLDGEEAYLSWIRDVSLVNTKA